MQKKILITGGLGFIGHHLTRLLLIEKSECQIDIVDNLSSTQIDYSWLQGRTEIHIMDLLDFEPRDSYSQIYHLASPVGSLGILSRNGYIARDIISLTYKVAELAINQQARLLFVSSSEIYGHGGIHSEHAEKIVPAKRGTRMEYGLGKLLAEEILYNLSLENKLDFSICRPFNVFGEHQSAGLGFVIPTFFGHALKNTALPVFMDGMQQRSFCYVEDIAQALLTVMERGAGAEIYNIGHDSNRINILDLAKQIISITGSRSPVEFVDPVSIYGKKYTEAFDKIPDISKIRDKLGWEPRYNLTPTLEKLKNFYFDQG